MAAFMISLVTIHESSWVSEYSSAVPGIVEAYGGRYLAQSIDLESLEGDFPPPTVAVIVEFPNKDAAKRFMESEEYAPWRLKRRAGSTSQIIVVEGL